MEEITNEDKLLAACAYAFFIPALYIILTDNRKSKFMSYAAAQSLFLWIAYGSAIVLIRFILGLIWSFGYVPLLEHFANAIYLAMLVFALFLATRAVCGENFRINFISNIADRLC